MIQRKFITPQVVEHFAPDGTSFGMLNEFEATDLRLQIAKEYVEGYYLIFDNQKIEINKYGKCSDWPVGLYDMLEKTIGELFKIQREQFKKNKI